MVGWTTESLGQLCEIKTGRKDVNQGNPEGKYPFFTCAREHTFSDEFSFNGEALLIAGNGDVGNTSYFKGKFEAYQRTYVLMGFDRVLPRYLFRVLDGTLKSVLYDKKLGNTMPYIKKGMLTEFPIPFPPLPEQKRIVAILDEAFAGIDAAVANTEKNLANVRELFESYLNAVFTQKGDGWVEKALGELCEKVEYGTSSKSKPAGSVPVLRMGNIQGGKLDWTKLVYTDNPEEIEKYLLQKNDVLFNRTNSPELVGKTTIYKGERPAIFAGYLIRIHRKKDLIDAEFLNYYLNSMRAREYGKTVMSGSVNQANISGSKLKEYPIAVPSLKKQEELVVLIRDLEIEVNRLEVIYQQKLEALAELKQSILQKAFAGELIALQEAI
jgi:type I restriction enzyme S subunit